MFWGNHVHLQKDKQRLTKYQEIKRTKTHDGMLQRQRHGTSDWLRDSGDNQLPCPGHMNEQWKLPAEYWEGADVKGGGSAGQKNKLQQTSSR